MAEHELNITLHSGTETHVITNMEAHIIIGCMMHTAAIILQDPDAVTTGLMLIAASTGQHVTVLTELAKRFNDEHKAQSPSCMAKEN